jgi:hypothetical protein
VQEGAAWHVRPHNGLVEGLRVASVSACGIAIAICAGPARAQQSPGEDAGAPWYTSLFLGRITPDKPWRASGSAILYGLDIGINLLPSWAAELDVDGAPLSDRTGAGHTTLYGVALDVLRTWHPRASFTPYVSLGGGVTHNTASPETGLESRTELMVQPGTGAFILVWQSADGARSVGLRPDIKVRWTHGWAHAPGNPVDPLYALALTFAAR